MAWIFQGNPDRFAIDDYLACFPELIYWYTPRYAAEIQLADRVFIWRSGSLAGVVAVGVVEETPVQAKDVRHQEALGRELWTGEAPDPLEVETGIRLDEVRLTIEEGMIPRASVKAQPSLSNSTIIRIPNGTVFRLLFYQGFDRLGDNNSALRYHAELAINGRASGWQ